MFLKCTLRPSKKYLSLGSRKIGLTGVVSEI